MAGEIPLTTIASKDLLAVLSAADIELSERRLRQLADEGFFPQPNRGEWDERKTLCGLAKYYRDLKGKKSKDFEAEEFRKLRESADEIAIRNEISRGRLVEAEAVYRENEKLFVALKARILASALSAVEKDELLADLVRLTAGPLAEPEDVADDPPTPGTTSGTAATV